MGRARYKSFPTPLFTTDLSLCPAQLGANAEGVLGLGWEGREMDGVIVRVVVWSSHMTQIGDQFFWSLHPHPAHSPGQSQAAPRGGKLV